jgi:hypothetical protein
MVLGVEVGVGVAGSRVSNVSIGMGVGVEMLKVGVSRLGWMEGVRVSAGRSVGRLQDANAKTKITTAIHKWFFIHSSFSEENLNRLSNLWQ